MVDFFRCSWFCSPLENFLRAPMVAPPLSWEERRFRHNQRYSDVSSVNVVQRHTVSGGVSKPSFNYCRVVCSSALPASCLQVNVVRSRSRLLSRGVLIISLVSFSVQCTLLHSRGKTWMRASEFGRIFVGRETSLASIAHVPCLTVVFRASVDGVVCRSMRLFVFVFCPAGREVMFIYILVFRTGSCCQGPRPSLCCNSSERVPNFLQNISVIPREYSARFRDLVLAVL